MNDGIPTGKTYLWIALKWGAIITIAIPLCGAVFMSAGAIAGFLAIFLLIVWFCRDSIAIGKRARRGIKQGYAPSKPP
jgi:hypothetical protein